MPDRSLPGSSAPESSAPTGLTGMLAAWLPKQRWFPGGGTTLSDLSIVSDVPLAAGDPALRHLIVQTNLADQPARFQVLVGCRADCPPDLASALIGRQPGRSWYDALHDPDLAGLLVRGIVEQRRTGSLRFVREQAATPAPGAGMPRHWSGGNWPAGHVLGAEQSNTSLVFGDEAILKVLRRLFPGANPDLEVADALTRLGSAHVAEPFGWIETELNGEPVLLGVLSRFLAGASDGWSLALSNLSRLYARHGAYGREYLTAPVAEPAPMPFADEAGLLGEATAEMHAELAAAFGERQLTPAELSALAAAMEAKLADATAVVPQLGKHAGKISAAYDAVRRLAGPVTVQRIHGDYHLGQVLRSNQGWVALDFEGEPGVPLAQRRAMAPPLRDVAGLLRSFDYAARHQLIGHPEAGQVADIAQTWVAQCQQAFLAGYAAHRGPGQAADPDLAVNGVLLRALTLEKAVYEVVYEYRHRPSWLSIPLDFLAAA